MDSDLFMVGGNVGEHSLVRHVVMWAFLVALVLYIIQSVWLMNSMMKKQPFTQKEGLLYWGASTNSVRDDYGTAPGSSLSEKNDAVVGAAYQDAINSPHVVHQVANPVASVPAAVPATFVGARQHMTSKKTPEQILQEQHHQLAGK